PPHPPEKRAPPADASLLAGAVSGIIPDTAPANLPPAPPPPSSDPHHRRPTPPSRSKPPPGWKTAHVSRKPPRCDDSVRGSVTVGVWPEPTEARRPSPAACSMK